MTAASVCSVEASDQGEECQRYVEDEEDECYVLVKFAIFLHSGDKHRNELSGKKDSQQAPEE